MADSTPVVTEVGKSIESSIEGLRWCRTHLQDRSVTLKLRELEQTLGALALALDYEMEGQTAKVEVAMEHAHWRPRSVAHSYQDMLSMYDH
jgi:hypothetical protein